MPPHRQKTRKLLGYSKDLKQVQNILASIWNRQEGKMLWEEELTVLQEELVFLIDYIDTYCNFDHRYLQKEFNKHYYAKN